MEILPILQGLSTPVLLLVGYGVFKIQRELHGLDTRIAIIETKVSALRSEVYHKL